MHIYSSRWVPCVSWLQLTGEVNIALLVHSLNSSGSMLLALKSVLMNIFVLSSSITCIGIITEETKRKKRSHNSTILTRRYICFLGCGKH